MGYHPAMPQLEPEPFYVDRNVLIQIVEQLNNSSAPSDQRLARYLREYDKQDTNRPAVTFLGLAARDANIVRQTTTDSAIERRSAGSSHFAPLNWGRQFIARILSELREIICGPKPKPSKLGPNAQAYIAAIAAAILAKFHVSSVTATGLAVLILLTLSRATKNAFCKMTDAEVLAALSENN